MIMSTPPPSPPLSRPYRCSLPLHKVVIYPSTEGLLGSAVLMAVVLGVLAHFFAEVPSRVMAFVRHRVLWHTVSLLCFMIGVGGMIFCIIRNPKTHGYDQVITMPSCGVRGRGRGQGEGGVPFVCLPC